MPFYRLHYHFIWATYQREPWLVDEVEKQIYGTILGKAKDLNCIIHAIGGIEDHIHLAITVPPKLAVSDVIGQLKGASSYYVNHQPQAKHEFAWQGGYGALSFGDASMPRIVKYVRNQKDHHRQNKIISIYERWDEDD